MVGEKFLSYLIKSGVFGTAYSIFVVEEGRLDQYRQIRNPEKTVEKSRLSGSKQPGPVLRFYSP